jgi:hypothetical protein
MTSETFFDIDIQKSQIQITLTIPNMLMPKSDDENLVEPCFSQGIFHQEHK